MIIQMNKIIKVAFVVSECVPFAKTGGLADVAGALPKALAGLGCRVKLFMPLYKQIKPSAHQLILSGDLENLKVKIGKHEIPYHVWYGHLPASDVEVYFIDNAHYYHRAQIYTDDPDEDERFILLQHGALQIMQHYNWSPDIVHCNDWQSALIPAMLKETYSWDKLFANTASVLSIHNIGYLGRFPKATLYKTGLDDKHFYPGGPFEFDKTFSFLKAGIEFADVLTTVSTTYAKEIQTHEYGAGMDGILKRRSKDLFGILNGIDDKEWNPSHDRHIPHTYSIRNLNKKVENKKALLKRANWTFSEKIPVIGIVSRLASQKGLNLLQGVMKKVIKLPVQIVALGSGEPKIEKFMQKTARMYPDQFFVYIGFNNELAHLITAGSDMFLMPSLYEPCGLNQMYSLNYGTVPIVRKTGGLADTVKDVHEYYGHGNGFSFSDYTPQALYATIRRALDVFADKKEWREIMKRGMKADFSWRHAAKQYRQLYEQAIENQMGE